MHKSHLVIVALAFLSCAVALYFGIRIYNANENIHLTELNEFDKIRHDNVELVPALSMLASLVTLPFILTILILELLILRKSIKKIISNLAKGMLAASAIILVFIILTIFFPESFDFSKWGFIWICLGLVLIAGNLLSFGIYRLAAPPNSEEE